MEDRTCAGCSTPIDAGGNGRRKWCSNACRSGTWQRRHREGAGEWQASQWRRSRADADYDRRSRITCAHCGVEAMAFKSSAKFCSHRCSCEFRKANPVHGPKLPKPPKARPDERAMRELWRSQRSPLRAAYEDGRPEAFFKALRDKCEPASDCWLWRGKSKTGKRGGGGYPISRLGGRTVQVHRLSAEMRYGDLDGQPVHHKCANSMCVNPDHLQPISHRENVAEMMQRNYLLDRIARLEDALREWAPLHPLLNSAQPKVG